jgi:non-ribosomal peptide synthetase component F
LKICEVISAGEQLRITDSIANLFGHWPDSRLINHYGPSESHVVTSYKLEGRPDQWPRFPPIGSPIDNTQIFLLDRFFHPVPIGVIGEIYIAGEGLAQGYLHHPAQTAEKFLPHPNFYGAGSGQRLYKTGDMGRYRPDGTIEFHGRHDHQIKLRGYRIELQEIEAALSQIHGVAETVVLCREDNRGEKQLVAYVKKAHE